MSDSRPLPAKEIAAAQNAGHPAEHDYERGSPHLRHASIRRMIESRLGALVDDTIRVRGECSVLEIGGGHGTYTRVLVKHGAQVVVTETSEASATKLAAEFSTDDVEVRHDADGEGILESTEVWDLVVIAAVLHHIPDYLTFVSRVAHRIRRGGAFFCVADPLYYPRMPSLVHKLDRLGYLSWRLFQGNYARGLATRMRRAKGVYSVSEPSDLVEYHVVRDGVDEEALATVLKGSFGKVEIFRYWANQAPVWQQLGQRTKLVTDFGIEARGCLIPSNEGNDL